jgi:hypothetical protein
VKLELTLPVWVKVGKHRFVWPRTGRCKRCGQSYDRLRVHNCPASIGNIYPRV